MSAGARIHSIQTTMILAFTVLIVFTIATLSVFSYYMVGESLTRNTRENTLQVVGQLNRVIEDYISYMDDIALVVTGAADVQSQLDTTSRGMHEDTREVRLRISGLLGSIMSVRKDIESIFLALDDGTVLTANPDARLNPAVDARSQEWYNNATFQTVRASLSSAHVQNLLKDRYPWVISLSRELRDARSGHRRGVLLVDLNYGIIEKLCSGIQLGKSGYVFIVNSEGEIVYHPRQQLIYSNLKRERIPEAMRAGSGALNVVVDGREVLYTVKTSAYTGWTIVGVSYVNELFSNRSQLEYYSVMIGLLCFATAAIISSFISQRISRPIQSLRGLMQEVERGNFDIDIRVRAANEVADLARDCNIAVKKVRDLMVQIKEEHELKQEQELKALQAQINPHFLYNTLDSIIWMIECGQNDDAVLMTSTLARFFRLGISRGMEIITVKDEVEHLSCYLTIQKMRYKSTLDYSIDVDAAMHPYRSLKLMLQPIVENAIYHGLKNKGGTGMIAVTGRMRDGKLVFDVRDNGAGMSEEELRRVESEGGSARGTGGVGIRNVRDRMQLYFGGDSSVIYESREGIGTTVTLVLPAVLQEEE
jgi:two-component system, sensor histidine kinase YesM